MARDFDEADRRIEEQERELARVQTDETTYTELESRLVREQLKGTLWAAAVVASIVTGALNDMADGFSENVKQMADDLNGDSE